MSIHEIGYKTGFLTGWLLREGWDPDTAERYVESYRMTGLDREKLGEPMHTALSRALLDYHAAKFLDQWQALAPQLREHLRRSAIDAQAAQPYRLGDRDQGEAVKLGITLETLSGLVASCPPPEITTPGPASLPTALAD